MPKHALGRQDPMAGNPAMHGTLQNFLTLALRPEVEKLEIATAIELDAGLFARALTLHPGPLPVLAAWPDAMSSETLQAFAIACSQHPEDLASEETALESSLLAAEVAKRAGEPDVTECRLTTLLCGADADEVSALVESKGLGRRVRDAVACRNDAIADLAGMPRLVRIAGAARALTSLQVDDTLMEVVADVVSLDVDEIREAAEAAQQRLVQVAPGAGPDEFLDVMLAEINTANAFYRAMMRTAGAEPETSFEEIVQSAGSFLLGWVRCCHLRPEGSSLVAMVEDAELTFDLDQTGSSFAAVMRGSRPATLSSSAMTSRAEVRLFNWLESTDLLAIPLGNHAGLLVCVPGEGTSASETSLAAFSEAAGDLFRTHFARADRPVIAIEEVKQRVREITHEVNNPLAIVQNYLATLRLKLGADAPVKELEAISRELVRVSSIVQKYRGIGDADEELRLGVANLNELVGELASLQTMNMGIELETRFDGEIPEMEFAVDAVKQVFVNILKNAIEAVEDVADSKITIETNGSVNLGGRAYIEISVTDNGPGMSTEQRLALFETNTTTKGEGRGLGLGIVRSLMDRMSGLVSCRVGSNGRGTCFQILLPL